MQPAEPPPDHREPRWQFTLRNLFGVVWLGALYLSTLAVLPQFFGPAEHGWRVPAACFSIWALFGATYVRRPRAPVLAIHVGFPGIVAVALLAALVTPGGMPQRGVTLLAESCLVASLLSTPLFLVQVVFGSSSDEHD